MISIEDYFGEWIDCDDATDERKSNAEQLIITVNHLLLAASNAGIDMKVNPSTGTQISGQKYGGFRPQSCPEGAPDSSHKVGRGVDIYDPDNSIDNWITDEILEQLGLYREHPDSTNHWCHLTNRAPHSGHRTFYP